MGPKTQRVYETIRSWIESGRYGPGHKLPSERALSAELEIGRTALRQVLARLSNEHFIKAHDRSSYRVLGGESVRRQRRWSRGRSTALAMSTRTGG